MGTRAGKRQPWLLALVPIALGVATLGIVWTSGLQNDGSEVIPVVLDPAADMRGAGSPEAGSRTLGHGPTEVAAPLAPSAPVEPQAPSSESSAPAKETSLAPADPAEPMGPPQFAGGGSGAPQPDGAVDREPLRLASLGPLGGSGGGGGGGGSALAPDAPPRGDSDADSGSDGDGGDGDSSAPSQNTPDGGKSGPSGDQGGETPVVPTSNDPPPSGDPDGQNGDGSGGGDEGGDQGNELPPPGPDVDPYPPVLDDPQQPNVRVPEPGSMGLLLLGLLGYAVHRRARK